MRTTIEMRDGHRARLLDLAARRGEKGFSRLVDEAIALYLEQQARQEQVRQRALAARGALEDGEVADLRQRATDLHGAWR